MATPTLAALKTRYPDAEIDVAVGAWTRPAFANNPRLCERIDTGSLLGGRRPGISELARVSSAIRRRRYDGAVVLERSFWLGLLPLLGGVPIRAGLDSGGRGLWHSIPVPVPPVRHEADLYLDCAEALGAGRTERMEFRPTPEDDDAAEAALRRAGWTGEPFALMHPGGGSNPGMDLLSKRWSPERFAAVGTRLAGRGLRAFLVWGRSDETPARDALAAAHGALAPLGSTLTLGQLAAVAGRAAFYLGNDSGPTHLALAVGTPTVAVFGPSDERRYGPWGRDAAGRPLGEPVANPALPPDAPAPAWPNRPVAAVEVDQVWAAIERVLSR